jgi:cytochrome c peroxidase
MLKKTGVYAAIVVSFASAAAQTSSVVLSLPSLKSFPVPAPSDLNTYVRDTTALTALGKAFFWDVQASSDGRVACGTCHFHAGADHRVQNQLASPPGVSTAIVPNQVLTIDMFPFHKLADPNNNQSAVLSDVRQAAGSAGVFHRQFAGLAAGSASENAVEITGEPNLMLGGLATRQVGGRNAASIINAVFNIRNFWDGRANPVFNGATPFGSSDPGTHLLVLDESGLHTKLVRMDNSSLASQAVGPPLNTTEMSYEGRTWLVIGRKLLSLPPLARQHVAPDDSVLGGMANSTGPGLAPQFTYRALIQAAFQPPYWAASDTVNADGSLADPSNPGFTQMEFNFSFFWGLAVQAYESTLISDDTRIDQFADGHADALTAQEQQGMTQFRLSACVICHLNTTLSSVTILNRTGSAGGGATHNFGFDRTGVSPIAEDIGFGFIDNFGLPLFTPPAIAAGAFKVTGFRNVELTGPYFHNGSQATLEQVVDFYNRHGDVPEGGLGAGVESFRMSDGDKAALLAFMKALTDDRVRYERAPFDHPELCVPSGHVEQMADPDFPGSALDNWVLVPAVGAGGNSVPLQTFEELLLQIGNDGSRAHTMTQACTPPAN